jgi:hypothetical protein
VPIGHVHHRQGRRGRSPHARLSVTTTQAIRPTAQGAFAILEGGERQRFIQLEHLQTFALELTKNVLTNYHQLFCKARCASPPFYLSETYMPAVVFKSPSCSQNFELYYYYNTTFSPCSSKRFPSAPLSRLPPAAPELSSSCSSNSPQSSRRRPKSSSLTHQTAIKLIGGINAGEPQPVDEHTGLQVTL